MKDNNNSWESVAVALKAKGSPDPFTTSELEKLDKMHNSGKSTKQVARMKPVRRGNYKVHTNPETSEREFIPTRNEFYDSLSDQLTTWINTDPESRRFPDNPFSDKQWNYVLKVMPRGTNYLYGLATCEVRECPTCNHSIRIDRKSTCDCLECDKSFLNPVDLAEFQSRAVNQATAFHTLATDPVRDPIEDPSNDIILPDDCLECGS